MERGARSVILVWIVAGWVVGRLLDWAADYAPRWAAKPVAVSLPEHRAISNLGALLAACFSRTTPRPRPARLWQGAAAELASALLFAYLWMHLGFSVLLAPALGLCAFLLLVALVDLRYRLVLNVMIFPVGVLALVIRALTPGTNLLAILLGGAFGLMFFALAAFLRPGELGGGDVKLAALIGLIFGFPNVLWALAVGILAGGLAALLLLASRRWQRASTIPYAPFLCFGAMIALFYNPLATFFPLMGQLL